MKILRLLLALTLLVLISSPANAFWMWTPETNKWVNPKYEVKDTPREQLAYAQGIAQSKDYPKAINEFEKLIKHYPLAREAAEARFQVANCYYEMGDYLKAYKSFQNVIEKYPFSERAPEIVKKQFEIANQIVDGKFRKNKFISAVAGTDYDPIEIYRTVIKNAPYGEFAAPAQYKIGLYLSEKTMYQEARDEFEKTMNDYPNSEWARAAKYQIALADAKRSSQPQYDQKVTKVAIDEFKDFMEKHPEAELSKDAKDQVHKLREKEAENNFVVAVFYEKQKKYDAARTYYASIVSEYKDTVWAKKAAAKIQHLGKQK